MSSNHQTWYDTSDPITIGTYVEDLISDYRWNQPDGRGRLGIVTDVGWDADYNQMAAMVDFGRNYSAGIVFSELSAIQVVPEPSTPALVSACLVVGYATFRGRRQPKSASAQV